MGSQVEADNASQVSSNSSQSQRVITALANARTIVGAILTVGCYFIGSTYYTRYLDHFHLDSQLFPLDTASYFVKGGMAVFWFCANILSLLNGHLVQSLLGALAVLGYFACLGMLSKARPQSLQTLVAKSLRSRGKVGPLSAKPGLRGAIKGAVLSAAALYVGVASLVAVMLFIGLPASIGEVAADLAYKEAIKGYARPCDVAGRSVCLRLEQDNKPFVEGFLIAASQEQVALYNGGVVSVLPLKGNRLISVTPAKKP